LWRPLSCGGPWETAQFAPPTLNPALQVSEVLRAIIDSVHDKAIVSDVDPGSTAGFWSNVTFCCVANPGLGVMSYRTCLQGTASQCNDLASLCSAAYVR